MTLRNDTIFALATPPGKSAVQIIRISGPGSARAVRALTGTVPKPRFAAYADIKDENGQIIDQALVLFFQAPASATGEDTAEIHLHGSPFLGRMVMERLDEMQHFRLADPGEFSRRAFLNGKINLDQAEGIADIIDANTISQHQQAIRQMDGALSRKTDHWRQEIISISAELAALIDFADEDLPDDVSAIMAGRIKTLIDDLSQELNKGHKGVLRRDGIKIALIGKPNAGKSTLLNHLTGDDRAIVSPEAGTTRDLVEVAMDINGSYVTITDTAGLRQDTGLVEGEGVKRALRAAAEANIVLLLVDAEEKDYAAVAAHLKSDLTAQADFNDPIIIPVLSKSDQLQSDRVIPEWLLISVHSGQGLQDLHRMIAEGIETLVSSETAPILTRQRHMNHSKTALAALVDSQAHDANLAPELMAEDLRRAASALGRISGHVDVEDLLDHIFSSFCIGK